MCSSDLNQVTMTSGVTNCVISASQSGNATTASASPITKTITATLMAQPMLDVSASALNLTFNPITPEQVTVTATGGAGTGTLRYSLRAGDNCSISVAGDVATVTINGAGVCRVSAQRVADANYLASNVASVDISVARALGFITIGTPPGTVTFGGDVTPPVAGINSVAALRYSSSNPQVVDVDPVTGQLTINGVGTATITISASASANFTAPDPVTYVVTVDPASPAAPQNVRTSLNGNSIRVTWDAPTFTGGTPLQKYVASASAGTQSLTCEAVADRKSTRLNSSH